MRYLLKVENLLKGEPTNYQTPDDEMTLDDFIIRYEHKFLRNIYTK